MGQGEATALAVVQQIDPLYVNFTQSAAEVMKLRGPGTRVVTLGKRALLPGFVDPHSHFLAAVVVADWANVSLPPVGPVKSIPDIIAVLRKQAARQKAKPGDWIVGDEDGVVSFPHDDVDRLFKAVATTQQTKKPSRPKSPLANASKHG